jgi:hypothetical protein
MERSSVRVADCDIASMAVYFASCLSVGLLLIRGKIFSIIFKIYELLQFILCVVFLCVKEEVKRLA